MALETIVVQTEQIDTQGKVFAVNFDFIPA